MLIQLETGTLALEVNKSDFELDYLTGFAARNNSKRGFLFVSKVLGKHWPVKPSIMQEIHQKLASYLVQSDFEGPVFMVGMAETATALGRGVFEEYSLYTGMDAVYSHTTRYRLQQNSVLNFSEEHCHATDQCLHLPTDPLAQKLINQAKTLVLIDDEMSTGKTFLNLINVLRCNMPQLERVLIVTLMDLTGQSGLYLLQHQFPYKIDVVSLLEGSFSFQAQDRSWDSTIKSVGDGLNKDYILPHDGGRTGIFPNQWDTSRLPHASLASGSVLVLGTGEFMYEPYRLALKLEKEGHEVYFQSTTRSPIMLGNDVDSILAFEDNYGESVDNFLYNVIDKKYDNILLCYETPNLPPKHDLPQTLEAQCCHLVYENTATNPFIQEIF